MAGPYAKTIRRLRRVFGLVAAAAFLVAAVLNADTGQWLRLGFDILAIGASVYLATLTRRPAELAPG